MMMMMKMINITSSNCYFCGISTGKMLTTYMVKIETGTLQNSCYDKAKHEFMHFCTQKILNSTSMYFLQYMC